MKLTYTWLAVALLSSTAFGQESQSKEIQKYTNKEGQEVQVSQAVKFKITEPASSWPIVQDTFKMKDKKQVPRLIKWEGYEEVQFTDSEDPIVQSEMGTRSMSSPKVNYNGLSGSGYPPDPSGAAGPNHYVQAVNTQYRIYNKNGGPVAGPFNLNSLWPGSDNLGDPIVMYDRHADRWFISQFQQNPNGLLIAISVTNDPTGQYYAYDFQLSQFPDYPKFSIWWDGYYMTSNSNHTAVVYERAKMLAGDPNAKMISLSLPSLASGGFRSPLPADADGNLPPNGTPCYFFNLEDNAFNGVSEDRIKIYEMNTNWTTPSSTAVSISQLLPVTSFDAVFSGGFANISQPGTTQKIDAIQGVLMYRAQHKRWTGYNTIVLSHAVDLGSNRAGVRWYELRDQNNGSWTVHQSGTYSPTATASRWMSSAAMDDFGNIGMAYSISDPTNTIYPGIRYTGRLAGDELNKMTFHEQNAVSGTTSQKSIDRYGDYAHLALDPDGKTFWYTGEYIGGTTNGTPRTRIFSFSIEDEAGIKNPYYENVQLLTQVNNGTLDISAKGIYGDSPIEVNVITMFGQEVKGNKNVQPFDGKMNQSFDVSDLSSGVYFVRIGNLKFQKVVKIRIQ